MAYVIKTFLNYFKILILNSIQLEHFCHNLSITNTHKTNTNTMRYIQFMLNATLGSSVPQIYTGQADLKMDGWILLAKKYFSNDFSKAVNSEIIFYIQMVVTSSTSRC